MDYFTILDLFREPFSNSPDPDFFFQSRQHESCLQRLELALRLHRGLNVVIGAVGTGKTTLCRQLIRKFAEDPQIETHLILDPDFPRPTDFLRALTAMFEGIEPDLSETHWSLKERIKHTLFRKGVDEQRTVVLIIDEGQKFSPESLELLRELLNYETNEHKLLQIALFAQPEFEGILETRANLADRINMKHILGPMSFLDTRDMIRFRLRLSSQSPVRENLFTLPAIVSIYRATGGYPRKIIHLCHQCLLAVIIQNKRRAGWALVRSCVQRSRVPKQGLRWKPALLLVLLLVFLAATAGSSLLVGFWKKTPSAPVLSSKASPSLEKSVSPQDLQDPSRPKAPVASAALPTPVFSAESVPPETKAPTAAQPFVPAGAEKAPPSASETAAPPASLGNVTLQDRETLWRLVEKVYGVFSPDHMESLRRTNPHIEKLDYVEVGTVVNVPAISVRVRTPKVPVWFVRIYEKSTLEAAVQVLRTHPESLPPVRIVPHWDPSDGLRFSVLLRRTFPDESRGRHELQRLDAGIPGDVFSQWPSDTVFYANPYARNRS